MSKEDMMSRYRIDGMEYALRIAKEQGIEGLEAEIHRRNRGGICVPVSQKELDLFSAKVKDKVFHTVLLMTLAVLRDTFGFGHIRAQRFMDRFQSKVDCIADGWASWEDYSEVLDEELGVKVEIDRTTNQTIVHVPTRRGRRR